MMEHGDWGRAEVIHLRDRDDNSFEDSERFEDDSQVSFESNEGVQNWDGWSYYPNNGGKAIQPSVSSVYYQFPNGRFQSPQASPVVNRSPRHEQPRNRNRSRRERMQENRHHLTANRMYQSNQRFRYSRGPQTVKTLQVIAGRICAEQLSFGELEDNYRTILASRGDYKIRSIPEKIMMSIIPYCFPTNTDDILMYSCLANGGANQFRFGEATYLMNLVHEVKHIGYLVTAKVLISPLPDELEAHLKSSPVAVNITVPPTVKSHTVSVKVDRARIVDCSCSCPSTSAWCQHVVAVVLFRMHHPQNVEYRQTLWDQVCEMPTMNVRKFVQYLINVLPSEYLTKAQSLIDELKDPESEINATDGAPDPTDGGYELVPLWSLDEESLHMNIRRLLCKYCVPSPSVTCDLNAMTQNVPPSTMVEWGTLMKPLRMKQPEGMWNLLSMVRELMARKDENATSLLRVITEEILSNSQVLLWWYITKIVQSGKFRQHIGEKAPGASQCVVQLNCAQLCDEVVALWKCVAINPHVDDAYRAQLFPFLQEYHRQAVDRIFAVISGSVAPSGVTAFSNHQATVMLQGVTDWSGFPLSMATARFTLDHFPGFFLAIQMCSPTNENSFYKGFEATAIFNLSTPADLATIQLVTDAGGKKSKKNKKKKKTKSRGSEQPVLRWEPLSIGQPGPSRVEPGQVKVVQAANAEREEESTESGQESDVQQPRRRVDDNPLSPEEDVNEAFAAAFQQLDVLDSHFLKCEASTTHGLSDLGLSEALKLTQYLLDSLNEQSLAIFAHRDSYGEEKEEDVNGVRCRIVEADDQVRHRDFNARDRGSTDSDRLPDSSTSIFALCQRFLSIMEKIVYVTHVLRFFDNQQHNLLMFTLNVLKIPRYPLVTRMQQVKLYYLESELVAILYQHANALNTPKLIDELRNTAEHLVANGGGHLGDVPPIALAQFIFENLPRISQDKQRGNPVSNTQQLKVCDEELALNAALTLLGVVPVFSEPRYIMHSEALRVQKGNLSMVLFQKYKDSYDKLSLILDKLLDPTIHRMYSWHQSNAAYLLQRDLNYMKHHPNNERPRYPYEANERDKQGSSRSPGSSAQKQSPNQGPSNVAAGSSAYGSPPPATEKTPEKDNRQVTLDSSKLFPPCTGLTGKNAAALNALVDLAAQQDLRFPDICINSRKKMKKLIRNTNPNAATTEAQVHHMVELAKKVHAEAGGSATGVVFAVNNMGLHRKLHMCSLLIAIYALGLHNRISPSWNTRNYSSNSSWITNQALEIGVPALEVIRELWPAHFTPLEIANLADKAHHMIHDVTNSREPAKLAMSVLPFSRSLGSSEIIRALRQIREHDAQMVESSLEAIVTPTSCSCPYVEVLFLVGRQWLELYQEIEVPMQQPMRQPPPSPMPPMGPPPLMMQPGVAPGPQPAQGFFAGRPPPPQQQPPPGQIPFPNQRPDMNRMHQSHSAPQLYGEQEFAAVEPSYRLTNAFRCGVLALEQMHKNQNNNLNMASVDDRTKFSKNPPFETEFNWLYYVASKLGPSYIAHFFHAISMSVQSPYILHYYASQSIQYFQPNPPPHMQSYNQPRQFVPNNFPPPQPPNQYQQRNYNSRNNSFSQRNYNESMRSLQATVQFFQSHGFHQVTGELFGRAYEQYTTAVTNKLIVPRFSENDKEEVRSLVTSTQELCKTYPLSLSPLTFDEFVRNIKKNKLLKKDNSNYFNQLLSQSW